MSDQASSIIACLVNGIPKRSIDITDRGLQYGDGLFETIAVVNGQALCWSEHLKRLKLGCEKLAINCPTPKQLSLELKQLLGQGAQNHTVLKIIITRGNSMRGYGFNPNIQPNRILTLCRWPEKSIAAYKVILCQYRLCKNPPLTGIKHLNRLEQILAVIECSREPTAQEGILCDPEGYLIEGIHSNLFFVKKRQLFTPDLSLYGISGIIREKIITLSSTLRLTCKIGTLTEADAHLADEMFLTNSIKGLQSVEQFANKRYKKTHCSDKIRTMLIKQNIIAEPL